MTISGKIEVKSESMNRLASNKNQVSALQDERIEGATDFRKKLFNKYGDKTDIDKNAMAITNAVQAGGGGADNDKTNKKGDGYPVVNMGILETTKK